MLTSDEVLNLNYYKKTSYTGWINGMFSDQTGS